MSDDKKKKRPWQPPRIVSTQTAFEHSILQCTGQVGGPRGTTALRSPKGVCTSGGANFS